MDTTLLARTLTAVAVTLDLVGGVLHQMGSRAHQAADTVGQLVDRLDPPPLERHLYVGFDIEEEAGSPA